MPRWRPRSTSIPPQSVRCWLAPSSGSRTCTRPRRLRMITSDPQVTQALDLLAPAAEPDVEAALQRQLALQAGTRDRRWPWLRASTLPIAAVLLLALALFAAPVRSLAAQLLTIFRVQDVTPI